MCCLLHQLQHRCLRQSMTQVSAEFKKQLPPICHDFPVLYIAIETNQSKLTKILYFDAEGRTKQEEMDLKGIRYFSEEDVAKHNKADDCW